MNSLVKKVTQSVQERGMASADDLLADHPDHTREQVMKALRNAKYRGSLTLMRQNFGQVRGSAPGIYAPANAIPIKAVNEVFGVWGSPLRQGESHASA